METTKQIRRIVITGGPCSGKSTFLEYVQKHAEALSYTILIDHESASDLISGGISPASMGMYEFQKYVVALQRKKEELFFEAAKEIRADRVVVFMDRGLFDDKGYVSDLEFAKILESFSLTEEEVLGNYDMVLHLTTAAKGTDAYTTENNTARYESREEAVEVDDMILRSWSAHKNRKIIPADLDFDRKMQEALSAVKEFLEEA